MTQMGPMSEEWSATTRTFTDSGFIEDRAIAGPMPYSDSTPPHGVASFLKPECQGLFLGFSLLAGAQRVDVLVQPSLQVKPVITSIIVLLVPPLVIGKSLFRRMR